MKPNNSVCLLTLASVCSALLMPAQAQPPEPEAGESRAEAEVPRFQSRAERELELQFEAHPEEARLLNTLEGEVLALYLPPLTSSPKGALLLTYTGERPGDIPASWDQLRRALPHYGWGTMLIALPPAAPAAIPPRPAPPAEEPTETPVGRAESNLVENSNNQIAVEPKAPVIPRLQRVASRLQAAILQLEQEGQLNLVVMVDNLSAAATIAHLKPGLKIAEANGDGANTRGQSPLEGPVRAMILANVHPHSPLSNQDLAQIFSATQLPTLDLFLGPESAAERRRHLGQAQRQKMDNYQPLTLPKPPARASDTYHSFWVQRLEGFMTKQTRGRQERLGTGRPF